MGSAEPPARRLAWDACYNVRDLGGYATEDGGWTRWRAVLRADNLCRLTPAGCAALVAYGVRTIVDLRHDHELRMAPHPFAHRTTPDARPAYLHQPLEDWDDAEYGAAIRAAASVDEIYVILLERYAVRLAGVVQAVARAPAGTVLVHCHAGKDRTGLVAAVLLALAGVPAATIAADYALSDDYLRPLYEELLSQATDGEERARLAVPRKAPPERMLDTLAWLERRYGGVRPYLLGAGLAEADIERIRARLRA